MFASQTTGGKERLKGRGHCHEALVAKINIRKYLNGYIGRLVGTLYISKQTGSYVDGCIYACVRTHNIYTD